MHAPERPEKGLERIQGEFLEALPRIEAHARVHFGHIRDHGRKDDCIANVIGFGWEHWLAFVSVGKDQSQCVSAIAEYDERRVRSRRRIESTMRTNNVQSPG